MFPSRSFIPLLLQEDADYEAFRADFREVVDGAAFEKSEAEAAATRSKWATERMKAEKRQPASSDDKSR